MKFTTTLGLISLAAATPRYWNIGSLFANNEPGKPNLGCILSKCGGKAAGCQLDKVCSKTLSCNNACPSGDLVCSEQCVTRYGNPQFDDLTVCIQSNNCIAPYPKTDYVAPKVVASLALEDFQGSWYTIAGLDKGLDCYNQQVLTVTKLESGRYNHALTFQFPEGPKKIESIMTETQKGVYGLDYKLGGGGHDDWYILNSSNNLIVVVYIGENKLSNYRGGYVYRATPGPLSEAEVEVVKAALESSQSGIKFEDFTMLTN